MTMNCPLPFNEDYRLAVLRSYQILDSEPEPAFDRLVRLGADLAGTPVALISLIDAERQWFKARIGLELAETPRSISFCQHTIMRDEPLIVRDAREDPRFAENPVVAGPPFVRFYAGFPLTVQEGVRVGTLCLIDTAPRPQGLDPRTIARLTDVAATISAEMRMRRAVLEARADEETRSRAARHMQAEAEAAKRRFLAIAGHELRTPLTGILGFCDLIEGEVFGPLSDPRYSGYVRSIRACGHRLHQTVERILTYARASAEEFELDETEFDPIAVIDSVVATLAPFADNQDIAIAVESAAEPFRPYADQGQFEHMLAQLLDNAVKFSSRNARVTTRLDCDCAGNITVSVVNPGETLNPDMFANLREAFVQAESGDDRRYEGMGLGLSIVDRLAGMHGATLSFELANGQTQARLEFPAYRWRPAETQQIAAAHPLSA